MNESENKIPNSSETEELREQLGALRLQVATLLVALVVVSGTLSVYLVLQARRARMDLLAFRPQAIQIVELSKREEPGLRAFVTKLNEFGRTHSDFMPILNKYKFQVLSAPTNTPTSAPPAGVTAPIPAIPAKK